MEKGIWDFNKKDEKGKFVLASLPYTEDHLEPYIGGRTVRYHYYKHLQAYIDKVNSLKGDCLGSFSITEIIRMNAVGRSDLYKNASQVFNHYFYFEQLNTRGAFTPLPKMENLIKRHYGSLHNLERRVSEEGMSVFGSGWVFITTDNAGKSLWVKSFIGTGTPITEIPLLALDVWEHSYYLDYQNDRKAYIENFFRTIDWSVIERRVPIIQ